MLLIITPKYGLFRKIEVYRFIDGTEAQMFEALQSVHAAYQDRGERHEVNISLVPITLDQLPAWVGQNVELNWLEAIRHRIRYNVTTLARNVV